MFKLSILLITCLLMTSLLTGCVIFEKKGESDFPEEPLPIAVIPPADNNKLDPATEPVSPKVFCVTDDDCVPVPNECHPQTCLHKKYAVDQEKPEVCTEQFDCSAAYSVEDCLCHSGVCVNERSFEPAASCN